MNIRTRFLHLFALGLGLAPLTALAAQDASTPANQGLGGPAVTGLCLLSRLGGEARLYPASGTTAAPVRPGQTLDRDYMLEAPLAAPGKALWIMGRFSEHPFPLDTPSVADVETVPVRVDLEP